MFCWPEGHCLKLVRVLLSVENLLPIEVECVSPHAAYYENISLRTAAALDIVIDASSGSCVASLGKKGRSLP